MANQLFAGFVFSDGGTAVSGATINLYDRNTVSPSRANTTTDANGYWAISHATEGRFDVEITNGTTVRRIKYDTSLQLESIETAVLRVRNPGETFDYDIVPAAIAADRQLNLPLITGTDTLATLGLAATFSAAQTFSGGVIFTTTQVEVADDILFTLGNDNDIVALNRSSILAANTALTGVMIGVPVTPAVAANSVIVSNVTASGDYLLALNNGGNSQAWQWVDSSAGTQTLYAAGVARWVLNATGGSFTGTISDLGTVTTVDINGGTVDSLSALSTGAIIAYINDSANTNMTTGLTINIGAADNEATAWKSSDVSHPFTDFAEADTFGDVLKSEDTSGGVRIRGFKSSAGNAGVAVQIIGALGEAADTTDTSTSIGVIQLGAYVTNAGTGVQNVADTGNAIVFANGTTARGLIKGNGDWHVTNTTLTALDDEDDIGLIRAYQKEASGGMGLVMSKWDDLVQANADDLKRVGVLSSQGDFIIQQRFNSLVGGSLWKLYTLYQDTLEELSLVKGQMAALTAGRN